MSREHAKSYRLGLIQAMPKEKRAAALEDAEKHFDCEWTAEFKKRLIETDEPPKHDELGNPYPSV